MTIMTYWYMYVVHEGKNIQTDMIIAIFGFQPTSVNMTSKPFHRKRDKLSMNQFVHHYQNVNAVLLFAYLFWNLKINLLLLIPSKKVVIYCPVECFFILFFMLWFLCIIFSRNTVRKLGFCSLRLVNMFVNLTLWEPMST